MSPNLIKKSFLNLSKFSATSSQLTQSDTQQLIASSLQNFISSATKIASDLADQINNEKLASTKPNDQFTLDLTAIENRINQLCIEVKLAKDDKEKELDQLKSLSNDILDQLLEMKEQSIKELESQRKASEEQRNDLDGQREILDDQGKELDNQENPEGNHCLFFPIKFIRF